MFDTLSDTEKQILENAQAEAMRKIKKHRQTANVLETALDYYTWLIEHGADSTYSTFCDDFGYPAKDGENRSSVFACVVALIGKAEGFANGAKV